MPYFDPSLSDSKFGLCCAYPVPRPRTIRVGLRWIVKHFGKFGALLINLELQGEPTGQIEGVSNVVLTLSQRNSFEGSVLGCIHESFRAES